MVEMRRGTTGSGSNLKRDEPPDLTATHHPIHSTDRCFGRHGPMPANTTDTSPTVQRGPTSSNMGSKENVAMVIMENDKAKVVTVGVPDRKESIQGNGVGVTMDVPPVQNKLVTVNQESHTLDKLIYMVSMVTIIMLSFSLVSLQWMLPYYYTVFCPLLLIIRLVQYWKNKWQFYLIDFCYFANIMTILYIWACPDNAIVFTILFGLANGPLTWAVIVFRNSVVFHSADKMTSTFIHVLPPYLLFCVRWYPKITSEFWYTEFNQSFDEDVGYMFLWLVGIPFACFVFHSLLYLLLVYGIFKPGDDYDTSFKYISTKTSFKVCTGALGPNHHFLMYSIFNYVYCIASLVFTPLWYMSFPAHCAYLAAASFGAFWNGAGYYLEVFGKRRSTHKECEANT